MNEPINQAKLDEWKTLHANATRIDKDIIKARYDHGGGRMFREALHRELILDCYHVDDRDFYFGAWEREAALIAEIERLRAENELLRTGGKIDYAKS